MLSCFRAAVNRLLAPLGSQRRERGQNLVELALTFPIIFIMLMFIIEMGRVWFLYEGAKMAATEGAHAASLYHNPQVGVDQLNKKLKAAGLDVKTATVTQIPNAHAYQANVTVRFSPAFGGLALPTVGGSVLTIIPAGFDVTYNAIDDISVY